MRVWCHVYIAVYEVKEINPVYVFLSIEVYLVKRGLETREKVIQFIVIIIFQNSSKLIQLCSITWLLVSLSSHLILMEICPDRS